VSVEEPGRRTNTDILWERREEAWLWEALTLGGGGAGRGGKGWGVVLWTAAAFGGGSCSGSKFRGAVTSHGPWPQLWSPACAIYFIHYINNNLK